MSNCESIITDHPGQWKVLEKSSNHNEKQRKKLKRNFFFFFQLYKTSNNKCIHTQVKYIIVGKSIFSKKKLPHRRKWRLVSKGQSKIWLIFLNKKSQWKVFKSGGKRMEPLKVSHVQREPCSQNKLCKAKNQ